MQRVTDFIFRIEQLEEEWQRAKMDVAMEEAIAAYIEAIYYQAANAGFDRGAIKEVVEARYNGSPIDDPSWTNRQTILTYLQDAEDDWPRLDQDAVDRRVA